MLIIYPLTEKVNGISDRLPLLTKKLSHFFLAKGGIKLSPSVKQVPLSPFPRKRAPRRLLRGGTSRSRSAGAFSDCVTRFRGGALRHAKFPKTSYKVQLLDTLKHAACVSLNHRRRRGLIFLSSKVLAPFKQNASVLSGDEVPSRFLAV